MENRYPSLLTRMQSIFIDSVFLIILMLIAYLVLDKFANTPDWLRIVLFASIFIFYEPVCMTFGCTIGNYIKKIRVKKANDTNSRINFAQAIIRYIVKVFLGWLSFITVHFNSSKRAIHDLASGSVMINIDDSEAIV